jgi:hypothetical protein
MPADTIHNNSWTPAGRKDAEVFTTPSGNKCVIRELELDDVLDLGIIDRMDSLTGIVQEDHIDRVSGKKKKGKQLEKSKSKDDMAFMRSLKDKDKRAEVTEMIEMIAVACVVKPKLHSPWINDPNSATPDNPDGRRKLEKNEREPDKAYVDYVNFVDKLAIFHEVFGGMERLQQFREAADEGVGDLADEPESEMQTLDGPAPD